MNSKFCHTRVERVLFYQNRCRKIIVRRAENPQHLYAKRGAFVFFWRGEMFELTYSPTISINFLQLISETYQYRCIFQIIHVDFSALQPTSLQIRPLQQWPNFRQKIQIKIILGKTMLQKTSLSWIETHFARLCGVLLKFYSTALSWTKANKPTIRWHGALSASHRTFALRSNARPARPNLRGWWWKLDGFFRPSPAHKPVEFVKVCMV